MSVRLVPAGDLALLVEFEEEISVSVSTRVLALDALITNAAIAGVNETVPAFRSLLVYYDPALVSYESLRAALNALVPRATSEVLPPSRVIELPCCYADAELGFELAAAAAQLGLKPEELVSVHASAEYLVYFLGFAPGQPYIGGVPERIWIPRLTTPRTRTPPGSVGIGGSQCCVYPVDTPGGFWVLGRTPVRLYDPGAPEPILLRAGDRLRFRPVARTEYDDIAAQVAAGDYEIVSG